MTRARRDGEAAGRRVRIGAGALLALLLALLLAPGAVAPALAHASLVSTSPGDGAVIDAAPSSFSLVFSEPVAPIVLRLVAPDGSAGPVDISINVLDGEFRILDARAVTLVLSQPETGIEPIPRPAARRGEANWRIDGTAIPSPVTWLVRVDILVTDFDLVRLEGAIAIRP